MAVADPEGVPWVPWNLLFEELFCATKPLANLGCPTHNAGSGVVDKRILEVYKTLTVA